MHSNVKTYSPNRRHAAAVLLPVNVILTPNVKILEDVYGHKSFLDQGFRKLSYEMYKDRRPG